MSTKSRKRARARAHAHQQQVRPQRHPRPVVAPKRREPKRRGHRLAEAPRRLYAYALTVAVLAGAVLIALSQISAREETTAAAPPSGVAVAGIAETAATFDGVPQRGNVLGSPRAPFQLVVYSDLQCGYCATFASDVLPTIVRDYVRTGKVQMVYRGLAFLGPDSVTALQTTTAAGGQNRLWNVSELLYANQGLENAWVTDDLLRSSVTAAGASATQAFAEREGAYVTATMNRWANMAASDGVQGVPAFYAGRRGGELEPLAIGALTVPEFRGALDSVVT